MALICHKDNIVDGIRFKGNIKEYLKNLKRLLKGVKRDGSSLFYTPTFFTGVLVFDWIVYDSIGDELETTFQISFKGKSITCFPYLREPDLFSLWAHIAEYFHAST